MKQFFVRNWISIFVGIFFISCIVASIVTRDKIYNPALEHDNVTVEPVNVSSPNPGTDIYTLMLRDVEEHSHALLFYSNHQSIYVHVNTELIYSLESADSIYGRTTGAMWNLVTLPEGDVEVSITAVQAYPEMENHTLVFERGSAVNMYRQVMDGAVYDLLLTLTIVLIGIILTSYWSLVSRKAGGQKDLLYLGIFAIVFGIWNFGETRFATFMFDNRAFWSYLAFTCLMIMCLPALYFFRVFMGTKDKYLHLIITTYIIGETFIGQFLHLTGLVGLKEMAVWHMASIVLILLYLLYATIMGIIEKKNKRRVIVNCFGLVILVATAVIDMRAYFTDILTTAKVAKVGFLIYIVILGIETTRVAREQIQEEQKLEIIREMAVKDFLTGCYNRNAYNEDVALIADKVGLMIIGFDLNDLKKCNDTKGHRAGDKYIMDAAKVICEVFGDLGKVYRVGGDEFCVIAKKASEEMLMKKKRDLLQAVEQYRRDNPGSGFGISCGYAIYDEAVDEDVEEIRNRADISMYENKREIKGN